MRGVGELDINRPDTPKMLIDESRPYLLLDLRDRDEYDDCHIITG
jgi:rhodanese-related sulfurtransferase